MSTPRRSERRSLAARSLTARIAFLALALATTSLLVLRTREAPGGAARGAAARARDLPPGWLQGGLDELDSPRLATGASLPRCRLEFSPEVRAAIEEQVRDLMAAAPSARVLTAAQHRWFPAVFRESTGALERTWQVEARLRGDLSNHWDGEQRSWRVRFARDEPFHGMSVVNFTLPDDKAWCIEALANHLARRAGVLTLRDGFVRLEVGAAPAWVYYLSEGPSEALLEARARPVSSVYRARDLWVDALALGKRPEQLLARNSPERFNPQLPPGPRDALHAAALDRLLRASTLTEVRAILDVERYLICQALAVLAGTRHLLDWGNSYAYLDDSTGRFEPIPFDVGIRALGPTSAQSLDSAVALEAGPLERILLASDPERARRDAVLWSWVADDGRAVLAAYDRIAELVLPEVEATSSAERLREVRRQVGEYRGRLRGNLEAIGRALSFQRASVCARFGGLQRADAVHSIEISNYSFAPLALEGIELRARLSSSSPTLRVWIDADDDGQLGSGDELLGLLLPGGDGTWLELRREREVLIYSRMEEVVQPGTTRLLVSGGRLEAAPTKLRIELVGTLSGRRVQGAALHVALLDLSQDEEARARGADRGEFLRRHPQFEAAEQGTVVLRSGVHRFETSVVVPAGVRTRIEAGAVLRMGPAVSLVATGPLHVQGREQAPVRFEPLHSGGSWGALAVLGPHDEASSIAHARFSGHAGGVAAGAVFSGGLCAHAVELALSDCLFERGRSEDAIHLGGVRGRVQRCRVLACPSDGLDIDGGELLVEGCTVEGAGGDGLDLSGCVASVLDCSFLDCADKGISVGEAARTSIVGTRVAGCGTGVAVKDGSLALLTLAKLERNTIGLDVYRKKAAFGGAFALARFCRLEGNQLATRRDAPSRLGVLASRRSRKP